MLLPIECTTQDCGEKAVRWAPFCTGCGRPLVASTGPSGGLRPEKKLAFSYAGSVQISPGAAWSASALAGTLVVVGDEAATVVHPTGEGVLTSRSSQAFRGRPPAALAFSRPWLALRHENPDGRDLLTVGSGGLLLQDLGPTPQGDQPTITLPLRRSSSRPSATGRMGTLCSSTKGFFALEDAEGAADYTLLRHIVVKASSRAPWVPECGEPSPALRLPGRGWVIDMAALCVPDRIGLIRASGGVAIVGLAAGAPTLLRLKQLEGQKGDLVGLAQAGGEELVCHLLHQGRSTLVCVDGNGAERIITTPPNTGLLSLAPTFRHQNPVVGARFDDSLVAVRPLQLDLTDGLRMVPKLSRVQSANQDGLVAIDEHQQVVVESNHGWGMLGGGAASTDDKVSLTALDWPHLWVMLGHDRGVFTVTRYVAHEAAP
jgi:hypothetical protein